jgi:hypothetical protein
MGSDHSQDSEPAIALQAGGRIPDKMQLPDPEVNIMNQPLENDGGNNDRTHISSGNAQTR